ncbi:V-ATPase V1 sector subunit E [Sporothrix bragantina]|uniref:V-ATPase V1 sector subunit E n=1 Tax=Sporothrix bragantina TaxID=671064 RepID=A0ABP0ANX7_9PEZI
MSQIHSLSDDQVSQELRKMTAFIKQEATEKAHEIQTKANEEFAIEKSKLVRQETDSIDATYEKKFKQATMSQQITRSTVANKTRLQVLTARQELLDNLFETARKKLAAEASSSPAKYKELLSKLVLEGAYALQEPKLQIRVRKADAAAAKDALAAAAKEYKKETGDALELTVDEENLPASGAGGVIIIGGGGKITIDNTLEQRLALIEHNALPAVRETLFGKNVNRKFYD